MFLSFSQTQDKSHPPAPFSPASLLPAHPSFLRHRTAHLILILSEKGQTNRQTAPSAQRPAGREERAVCAHGAAVCPLLPAAPSGQPPTGGDHLHKHPSVSPVCACPPFSGIQAGPALKRLRDRPDSRRGCVLVPASPESPAEDISLSLHLPGLMMPHWV